MKPKTAFIATAIPLVFIGLQHPASAGRVTEVNSQLPQETITLKLDGNSEFTHESVLDVLGDEQVDYINLANKATGKSYDDENFSVWLPGVADLPQKGMLSSVDASTHTYYATVYQDFDFLQPYLPLPDSLISQTLETVVSAFSQEKNFQIISKKSIKKGDIRGIEFTAKDQEGYYSKTQVFLNGSRIYILMALTDQSTFGSEADKFFNSLSLY